MAKFNTPVNAFIAGEVSDKVISRADVQQFPQSCETLQNQVVYPQGGAFRRPGSRYYTGFSQTSYYSDTNHRDIPFVAANGKRFVIIARGGVSNESWPVVDLDGTGGIINISVSLDDEIFTDAEIDEMQYAQSGDYVFFAHPNHLPFAIYYDGTNFFVNYLWDAFPGLSESWARRPFLKPELNNANGRGTLTASGTTGSVTITSSAGIFRSSHVGVMFKMSDPGATPKTGVFQITAYTNATTVTATVISTLPGTTAIGGTGAPTTSWEEQAWSYVRGCPRAVCLFQQRLYFGGTASNPDTVWGSQQGDLKEFMYRPFEQSTEFATYTQDNSRAFDFTIASVEPNLIQWLSPGKTLTVGTQGREYICTAGDNSIGPVNLPNVQAQTSYGSAYVQPVRKDSFAYFVQRSGQNIRDFQYNNDQDVYKSDEVTELCDHLIYKRYDGTTMPKIKQMCLQASNPGVLWYIDNLGGFSGITVRKDAQIQAGHWHQMGGFGDVGDNPPKVVSICVIPPTSAGGQDTLFMSVQRYVEGATRMYFEYIPWGQDYVSAPDFEPYLDSCVLKSGTSLTGLNHLKGENVSVVADGVDLGDFTVSASGTLTISGGGSYASVFVGFGYRSRIVTQRIEAGSQIGTAQGLQKRIDQAVIRFFRSAFATFGRYGQVELNHINFRDYDLPTSEAFPLYSGDKVLNFPAGYDRRGQIIIETDRPLPMHVSGVFLRGVTYD